MPFFKQENPFVVPTTDGKLIEEHIGASTGETGLSIAHMLAPAGWNEPFQNPEFDVFVSNRDKKLFEVDGEKITVSAGQSILIKKGSRVRYSNPFEEACEYWSICLPAFSMENVHRED